MRLIDANKIVYSWQIDADGQEHDGVTLQSIIRKMPTIEERKEGKWIQPCDIAGFGRCSCCNALWDNSLIENRYFRYCPRCGADMRGEQE